MMSDSLQQQVWSLFHNQLKTWPLASKNYQELASVKVKRFPFQGYDVLVQFNPARMVSSGAKVDKASIAKRACFLCEANRPSEQQGISWGKYSILVNPFPIFPEHFTIARQHEPQQILPYFPDMLALARDLPDLLLFYNGPCCGASAPDHMHFQAGTQNFLPIVGDYMRLRQPSTRFALDTCEVKQYSMPSDYGRSVIALQSADREALIASFKIIYHSLQGSSAEEPMMNVVCWYDGKSTWQALILPRGAFRPTQYGSGSAPELLVSPATVEMGGVVITPILEHFERITAEDIQEIYRQVTLAF